MQEEEEKAEQNFPFQMRESLTKTERIRSKADFQSIFKNSSSAHCRGAKMLYRINELDHCRFGVTLRKHYGNSVQRNYARRVMKEIFRTHKDLYKENFDILIILYPGKNSYQDRQEQFFKLLQRADIAKMVE